MKVHKLFDLPEGNRVEAWYDRSTQCWWAAQFDAEDFQIGDAIHANSKRWITSYARSQWQVCGICGESRQDRRCRCEREMAAHEEDA